MKFVSSTAICTQRTKVKPSPPHKNTARVEKPISLRTGLWNVDVFLKNNYWVVNICRPSLVCYVCFMLKIQFLDKCNSRGFMIKSCSIQDPKNASRLKGSSPSIQKQKHKHVCRRDGVQDMKSTLCLNIYFI